MSRHLPQPNGLQVEKEKIRGYLLNPKHEEGASKEKFFRLRGFKIAKWKVLAEALRQHGVTRPVVEEEKTKFGKKYTVECELKTPDGKNPCVLTVWVKKGSEPPRLITARPNL